MTGDGSSRSNDGENARRAKRERGVEVRLVGALRGAADEPDLAVAEPRDGPAVDRSSPATAERHLDLDAASGADLDLVHAERVALKQSSHHAAAIASASVQPLAMVFSISALMRPFTPESSAVWLKARSPDWASRC
jgi:hypothetical protein